MAIWVERGMSALLTTKIDRFVKIKLVQYIIKNWKVYGLDYTSIV